MAQLISVSVDVKKLLKEKFVTGKNGGVYVNLTFDVKDEKDKYDNDVSVWQGQSKAEREAKEDRNFVGNGRVIWTGSGSKKPANTPPEQPNNPKSNQSADNYDDLPF
jgi:hypothetical protein